MDIHPNIGYICHGSTSLYVVIPVCFLCGNLSMTGKSTFQDRSPFILSKNMPPACSDCQKSPKICTSSRTSPQAGVAIPKIDTKMFENPGDCHASVCTGSQWHSFLTHSTCHRHVFLTAFRIPQPIQIRKPTLWVDFLIWSECNYRVSENPVISTVFTVVNMRYLSKNLHFGQTSNPMHKL